MVVRAFGQDRELLFPDAQLQAAIRLGLVDGVHALQLEDETALVGPARLNGDRSRPASRRGDERGPQPGEALRTVGERLHQDLALAALRLHDAAYGHEVVERPSRHQSTTSMSHSTPRRRATASSRVRRASAVRPRLPMTLPRSFSATSRSRKTTPSWVSSVTCTPAGSSTIARANSSSR